MKIILDMPFGERLKKVKEVYRLKKFELADICGVTNTAITNYFNDKNVPNMHVVQKLLETFPKLNSDWLITGKGEMLNSGRKYSADSKNQGNVPGNSLYDPQEEYANVSALREIIAEKDKRIEELKDTIETQKRLLEKFMA